MTARLLADRVAALGARRWPSVASAPGDRVAVHGRPPRRVAGGRPGGAGHRRRLRRGPADRRRRGARRVAAAASAPPPRSSRTRSAVERLRGLVDAGRLDRIDLDRAARAGRSRPSTAIDDLVAEGAQVLEGPAGAFDELVAARGDRGAGHDHLHRRGRRATAAGRAHRGAAHAMRGSAGGRGSQPDPERRRRGGARSGPPLRTVGDRSIPQSSAAPSSPIPRTRRRSTGRCSRSNRPSPTSPSSGCVLAAEQLRSPAPPQPAGSSDSWPRWWDRSTGAAVRAGRRPSALARWLVGRPVLRTLGWNELRSLLVTGDAPSRPAWPRPGRARPRRRRRATPSSKRGPRRAPRRQVADGRSFRSRRDGDGLRRRPHRHQSRPTAFACGGLCRCAARRRRRACSPATSAASRATGRHRWPGGLARRPGRRPTACVGADVERRLRESPYVGLPWCSARERRRSTPRSRSTSPPCATGPPNGACRSPPSPRSSPSTRSSRSSPTRWPGWHPTWRGHEVARAVRCSIGRDITRVRTTIYGRPRHGRARPQHRPLSNKTQRQPRRRASREHHLPPSPSNPPSALIGALAAPGTARRRRLWR